VAIPDAAIGRWSAVAAESNDVVSLDVRDSVADWVPFTEPPAPEGAPNVLFVVWDDMGFGSWDAEGVI
jgi:arylsulfatase